MDYCNRIDNKKEKEKGKKRKLHGYILGTIFFRLKLNHIGKKNNILLRTVPETLNKRRGGDLFGGRMRLNIKAILFTKRIRVNPGEL